MSDQIDPLIPITVVFYSTLKKVAQQDKADLEIEKGTSLEEVLVQIQEEYFLPNNGRILGANNNKLDVGMICLVDDTDYNLLGGLRYHVEQSITITLISSLHGG